MKRGPPKTSSALPEQRVSRQPRQSPSSSAPPNASIQSSSSSNEAKEKLMWMLYMAAQGLGVSAPYSMEFLRERASVDEAAGVRRPSADINDVMQKMIQEQIMREQWSRIPSGTGSTGEMHGALGRMDFVRGNMDWSRAHYGDDMAIVVKVIPAPRKELERDPDGHCHCIFRRSAEAKVLQSPGYPAPVPKPTENKMRIKKTAKGVTLTATKDIKVGELIFAERPILVKPVTITKLPGPDLNVGSDQKTLAAVVKLEWEKLLEDVVGKMDSADRDAYLRLPNSHKEDGSGPLSGIVRTNGFELDGVFDGPKEKEDGTNTYTGVVKIGSYIRHSCSPNTYREFSVSSFSFQFYAMVDIKAGQEIFVSYCNTGMPVAERRKTLASYGFTCHCKACDHATGETDKLRQGYISKTDRLLRALNWQRREGNKVSQTTIDPIIKLKNALEKEGLMFTLEYKSIVVILAKVFEELGQEELAKVYKEESLRYNLSIEALEKYGV